MSILRRPDPYNDPDPEADLQGLNMAEPEPPIELTFVCPYPRCAWPTCLQSENGWQTWPACRSAEAEVVDQYLDAISDRIATRPGSLFPKDAA